MFGLFKRKKEVEELKEGTKQGFESVKKDISAVSGWIKHLDSENNLRQKDIDEIKDILSTIQEDMEGIKNVVGMMSQTRPKRIFQTPSRSINKQSGVLPVQTAVGTAVQTPNLEQFSVTERAILWVLLNSDMKLSYEDLAAMLGKEKSTIRGQINSIKSKSGVVEEQIEKNGKKRVFIPEEIRENMLKKAKVRVNKSKNKQKREENE
jgi:predicted transcriptional regulator